ncbi:MAG: peroxidase family protein [Pseudomonadota bacterium]
MPRLTEARYADGLGELYETTDPMTVARTLFDQDGDIPNSQNLSTLFTTWGQFLDHDLTLTRESDSEFIDVDGMDHDVARSTPMDGTGVDGPREYGNGITWQIDGSQIYGSEETREAEVRSFEGGKLTMSDDPTSTHGLLPLTTEDQIMAGESGGEDAVYLAGDVRANENPNLLSLHTLFAREHNYWADRLAEENPDWDDQELFEAARSIVEYELQKITYEEWLPHLIGGAAPQDVDDVDHDPDAVGQVSLEFSTAAFRFGHTLVSGHMPRLNEDGSVFEDGHLALLDNFFNPDAVKEDGIDSLLRGQAAEHAQELDTKVVDDLNFFLATPEGVGGFSLPALNLVRGADHGLGSYVDVRAQLLGDIDPDTIDPDDFSIITSDPAIEADLAAVYDTVFDVDLWVGGLAEDKIDGTQSGPLFTHILSEQFHRTAAADETFGDLDPRIGADILAEVRDASLSDVILRTTDIDTIQDDPFVVADRSLTFTSLVEGTWQGDDLEVAALDVAGDVDGGDGDDTITVTGGSDIGGKINAGDGADKVLMSSGQTRWDIDMGRGDDNEVVDLSGTAVVGDDIRTDDGNDVIRMEDVAQVTDDIDTRGGDDRITIAGKAVVGDLIRAGDGNDEISVTEQASVGRVDGGAGDDVIFLSDAAVLDLVVGGSGDDILRLSGRGFDVTYDDATSGTISFLDEDGIATGQTTDFTGIELVAGDPEPTPQDDTLVGTLDDDTIAGLAGDDRILGLDGDDNLRGDQGNDVVEGGNGDDRVAGNSGWDTLGGGNGDDRILGGSGNDDMTGGAGADRVFGGTGDDTMFGNSGDDMMIGGWGNDAMFGGTGNDRLAGGGGDDDLRGGDGDDKLLAGDGADTLIGGDGDDTLVAGGGTNTLTGGDGSDRFEAATGEDGQTTITDYSAGDTLAVRLMNEEEIITLLLGQGDGNDALLLSDQNAAWSVLIEDAGDLDEDDLTYF